MRPTNVGISTSQDPEPSAKMSSNLTGCLRCGKTTVVGSFWLLCICSLLVGVVSCTPSTVTLGSSWHERTSTTTPGTGTSFIPSVGAAVANNDSTTVPESLN